MTTPVYEQFPHKFTTTTGSTTISVSSGIIGGVVISNQTAAVTIGKIIIADAASTIAIFGVGTAAGYYKFATDYAQPLVVNLFGATGSDCVTVMAGPV